MAVGLAMGTLLGRYPVGLAQPAGEEEQAQAQQEQDEAAVQEKRARQAAEREEKRAQLAAEAEAAGLTLGEYLQLRREDEKEKRRVAVEAKLAEISAPPVVVVHEPFVLVVKGRVLYQFDLQTLELLHWAALDPPEALEKKALLEQKEAEDRALQVK
jgi:hypothetical protein